MVEVDVLLEAQLDEIMDEALAVLEEVGVAVSEPETLAMLDGAGASVDGPGDGAPDEGASHAGRRVRLPSNLVERCVDQAPSSITLYDIAGEEAMVLSGRRVHFNPGSTALNVYDPAMDDIRRAEAVDCIRFAKVVDELPALAAQSTAITPDDVPREAADVYRLAAVLLHSSKPVVTGTFGGGGFEPMREMLVAVRGSEEALREKPLAIFDCCPAAPLRWTDHWCRDLAACARAGIPAELISMPQPGLGAPITLHGSLVQHTAESLSGLVIAQLARSGAPVIWGGSPTTMNLRSVAPLLGAPETWLMASYVQIGRRLGLPTHVYLGLSDAKRIDAQAGFEWGTGLTWAALLGVNNVSGPGMLDCESAQSIEGIVISAELCGAAMRVADGISEGPGREAVIDSIREVVREGMPDPAETMRVLREGREYFEPGRVIDRLTLEGRRRAGMESMVLRAVQEVDRLLSAWSPPPLEAEARREIVRIAVSGAGTKDLPGLTP